MTTPCSGPTSWPVCANCAVLRGRRLERVGHVRGRVCRVGEAARLAVVEAACRARGRPQVQRGQRVDLPGTGNRGHRAENALRLVDAGAVVGLDAAQVEVDERRGRDLLAADRLLDLRDGRLLQVEAGSWRLRGGAGAAQQRESGGEDGPAWPACREACGRHRRDLQTVRKPDQSPSRGSGFTRARCRRCCLWLRRASTRHPESARQRPSRANCALRPR